MDFFTAHEFARTPPPLDVRAVLESFQGNRGIAVLILENFAAQIRDRREALALAVLTDDSAEIVRAAHDVAMAAFVLRAAGLISAAERVEAAAGACGPDLVRRDAVILAWEIDRCLEFIPAARAALGVLPPHGGTAPRYRPPSTLLRGRKRRPLPRRRNLGPKG